ncbi:hypothetical protein A1QY_00625 [Vibrio anguillarum]|uniref:hypothetical protein n=1 Tax=Vibrio anguillarum TaxID=55601 RepID=UPI0002FF688D|nr:hypothetical protein [Vibrio anguillarum]OEF91346.1 hypothetical protein A1QY_00625 [Vibrio anguillarum]
MNMHIVKQKFSIPEDRDVALVDSIPAFRQFEALIDDIGVHNPTPYQLKWNDEKLVEFRHITGMLDYDEGLLSLAPIVDSAFLNAGRAKIRQFANQNQEISVCGYLGMEVLTMKYLGSHNDIQFCKKFRAYPGTFLHIYRGPHEHYEVFSGNDRLLAQPGETIYINDLSDHYIYARDFLTPETEPLIIIILKLYQEKISENVREIIL